MLDPETLTKLRQEVASCVVADRTLLVKLRRIVMPDRRSATAQHNPAIPAPEIRTLMPLALLMILNVGAGRLLGRRTPAR